MNDQQFTEDYPDKDVAYHDYSDVTESSFHLTEDVNHVTFPVTLHHLLSKAEEMKIEHIVGWCPHGRSIQVRDQAAFEKEIIPL
jgi:hypothetical protein